MLYAITVHCILPREWCNVVIGGEERNVLFVDCDLKFNLSRILQLMKTTLMNATTQRFIHHHYHHQQQQPQRELKTNASSSLSNSESLNGLIRTSLQRLHLLQPRSSLEFQVTLSGLITTRENFFLSHRVSVLLIDALDCYYWVNRYFSTGLTQRLIPSDIKIHAEEECLRQILNRLSASGVSLCTLVTVTNDYRQSSSSTHSTLSNSSSFTLHLNPLTHTLHFTCPSTLQQQQQRSLGYRIHPLNGFQVVETTQNSNI